MRFFILIAFLTLSNLYGSGQMMITERTMYGHEWIDANLDYHKITITEDGIYKISFNQLVSAGISPGDLIGGHFIMINLGEEVPIFTSTEELFSASDHIIFHGLKNRGELDRFLYEEPDLQQLNPEYSLYTDENAYYLVIDGSEVHKRITAVDIQHEQDNLPPLEKFYMHRDERVFSDVHFKPTHNGRDFIRYSSYDTGEGYGSEITNQSKIPFSLDHIYTQGTRPKVEARFATTSSTHFIETKINDLILNKYVNSGYGINDFSFTFNTEHLAEELCIDVLGLSGEKDRHTLASLSITYPREFDFNNTSEYQFELGASFIPRYLEIRNFKHTGGEILLFDVANNEVFQTVVEDELVKVVLPSSSKGRQLILINEEGGIKRIDALKPFRNSFDLNSLGDYIIITNKVLSQKYDGVDWIAEYAKYRSSEEGGSFTPSIIDVNVLYEHFSYGIEGHSMAVKNFLNHLIDTDRSVGAVFIIGKGLEYPSFREKSNLEGRLQCFVPTYGTPGGDNLFTASGFDFLPQIPIGRLAAQSPEEVKNYLGKVRSYESPMDYTDESNVLWRKKVLHLSGGSADIQDLLYGYLNEMGDIISTNRFGGDVFTFRKTTADLLQSSQTNEIINRINEGVSLITFFGHAAVGTFDFSLEDPSRYNNEGRNPIILSLGCHSGNVHTDAFGLSEDFVLEPQKGAVAFIASSGTAYINPQYRSGINFYNYIGDELEESTIGEVVQNSLKHISENQDIETVTLSEQLTIHGDPVLKFKMSKGPDYSLRHESFLVEPDIVNSTLDSFKLTFEIVNRGSFRKEKLDILIEHLDPKGESLLIQKIIVDAPSFSERLTITLPNPGISAVGENEIRLTIDPDNKSEEYPIGFAENNNQILAPDGRTSFSFFILDNKAQPIYPPQFGILNQDIIQVHASSYNGLLPLSNYLLQMDTTETFDSPMLISEVVEGQNSNIVWEPDVVHLDNTVYYWRLSPVDLENNERKWAGSSFVYAPGEREGWNQSHYYQWKKNDYQRLFLDDVSRKMLFGNRSWDIRVKNELFDPQDYWVFINGTPWASLNPRQLAPVMSVFIWHPKDVLFKNKGKDFGSLPFSSDAFIYRMNTPADRKNIISLLDAAPEGSRIFIHTILKDDESTLHIEDWQGDKDRIGIDLFETMKSYGAIKFDLLKERGTVPYTYIFDKGSGPVAEDIANSPYETIDLSSVGRSYWEDGYAKALEIGPVKRFMRLEWAENKEASDLTSVVLLGKNEDGTIDTLRRISDNYDVNLTFIHPDEYPTIQLIYDVQDSENKSAPELEWWRVYYQDLPDVTFDLVSTTPDIPDTIKSGEELILSYGIINLSDENIDPFKVKYTLTNDNNEDRLFYSDESSLSGGAKSDVAWNLTDILPEGRYKLTIEINDDRSPQERSYDNNIGIIQFFVKADKRDPLLSIKVNDEVLTENSLVGISAIFEAELSHPSSPTLLEDPSLFEIFLKYPSGKELRFTQSEFEFEPATNLLQNTMSAFFEPELDEIGRYTLIVRAEDGPYETFSPIEKEVHFYVNDQDVIKSVSIYPNPTRHFAQIDIELIGAEVPEEFAIHIFDAKGKKIGTISRTEFQNIRTAPRVRSHLWRATDTGGINLASGIYLLKIDGKKSETDVKLSKRLVVIK